MLLKDYIFNYFSCEDYFIFYILACSQGVLVFELIDAKQR